MKITKEFQDALAVMESGKSPLFITGKAGTGKSTLLDLFRSTTKKRVVVLAPTGMAALNVGGATIHSFFRFPPGILKLNRRPIRPNPEILDLCENIDTIILDEISMVRADVLDAMDKSLKLHRSDCSPFGGVQVVLIGDVFQLLPVVRENAERGYFAKIYHTHNPLFFYANVLKQTGIHVIELNKVFRQTDEGYVDLLDKIRKSEISKDTINIINNRCEARDLDSQEHSTQVVLTTTNSRADEINASRLQSIDGQIFVSNANISPGLRPQYFPTSDTLLLKKNARIMMLKNNGDKWVNGSLGYVTGWDGDKIFVSLDSGNYSVSRDIWHIIKYRYNKARKCIEEHIQGSFEQFPLKLAWAITIHKSQGQTFDEVCIDVGRGAFSHGHLYVAFSRCRSFEGVRLIRPIRLEDFYLDKRVKSFIQMTGAGGHVDLSNCFLIHPRPTEKMQTMIDEAIAFKKQIYIEYIDYDGIQTSRIISSINRLGMDKIEAFCHLRSDKRKFRVSRIQSAELDP